MHSQGDDVVAAPKGKMKQLMVHRSLRCNLLPAGKAATGVRNSRITIRKTKSL